MIRATAALLLAGSLAVHAQIAPGTSAGEGAVSGPTSSAETAGYSCDPNTCRLPACHCASTDIPGGLSRDETPMFITWTNDDAIQSYTIEAVNHFLGNRRNPNGCPVKSTYFVSLNYTNHSMATDWYVAGNEIADHTMTHVGDAPQDEINGNLAALNAFSGIPLSSITGFRAPYLNYSINTLRHLQSAKFDYDSSVSAATFPNASAGTYSDAFWPYTLDNGLANDCMSVEGICKGEPKIPGMWEIPMYAVFDDNGMPYLMDVYLENSDMNTVLRWYQNTFNMHYNGNRQPFGLYQHPIHLAIGYPGLKDPDNERRMINQFLDWAQQQQNVWIVTNQQLLAWMRNPVPVSRLNEIPEFQCQTPQVSAAVCNGMYPNEVGLLQNCPFPDFPWTTCYGCPVQPPTPANPVPAQVTPADGETLRYRLPANCSTAFWDPVGNKCLCSDSTCQFSDATKPIGANGANLTGGGTGSDPANPTSSFVPFGGNGAASSTMAISAGLVGATFVLSAFGALFVF